MESWRILFTVCLVHSEHSINALRRRTFGDTSCRNYIQEQEGAAGTAGNPQVKALVQKLRAVHASICDIHFILSWRLPQLQPSYPPSGDRGKETVKEN